MDDPTAAQTQAQLQQLTADNERLRYELEEAQDLIDAVRTGAVDALAIQGPDGPRIFTLEGADQRYRTLIEQMSEGALLIAEDSTILYCNACLAGWLQLGLEEVIGKSFEPFVSATLQEYWATLLAQGWTAGMGRGELMLQPSGAEPRPVAVSVNPMTFNDTPTMAVILTDLSAQRQVQAIQSQVAEQSQLLKLKNEELRAQEAARRASERAEAAAQRMLEGIPHIAWTADLTGQNTYLNSRWFDYVEPQGSRSRPQWLLECLHPDDLPAAAVAWEQSIATEKPLEVQCRIRNAAGDYRWMLGRALPSRDEEGQIIHWIGTYTDIHEHQLALARIDEAQHALQENNEQLRRANVDLDNFVYTASHDLKAPITNIEGLLDALQYDLREVGAHVGEAATIMDMMQDSVERFKRTIEHLTQVTKLQKEDGEEPELVNLAQLIAEVQLDLAPQIQASGARIRVKVEDFPFVSFSEKNLRSVVFNLLSNALKYRHPDRAPEIRIRCRAQGTWAALSVKDNGLGLDLSNANQKLFALFQRLHDHVEGSGLGLYMVKKMVENAGGKIEVASQAGVGSTFTVYLRQP